MSRSRSTDFSDLSQRLWISCYNSHSLKVFYLEFHGCCTQIPFDLRYKANHLSKHVPLAHQSAPSTTFYLHIPPKGDCLLLSFSPIENLNNFPQPVQTQLEPVTVIKISLHKVLSTRLEGGVPQQFVFPFVCYQFISQHGPKCAQKRNFRAKCAAKETKYRILLLIMILRHIIILN